MQTRASAGPRGGGTKDVVGQARSGTLTGPHTLELLLQHRIWPDDLPRPHVDTETYNGQELIDWGCPRLPIALQEQLVA